MHIDVEIAPEFEKAIECLGRTHEVVDRYTANHDFFVGKLVEILSLYMGVSEQGAKTLNYASRLHDIGKIALPKETLHAPRKLTPLEREKIKEHSLAGARILKPNNTPFFDLAADIAAKHHEYVDGSGYPFGLSDDAIPLAVKIVTFCDVYEALRARRAYKAGMSHEEAARILLNGDHYVSSSIFDAHVLSTFSRIQPIFSSLYDDMVHQWEGGKVVSGLSASEINKSKQLDKSGVSGAH